MLRGLSRASSVRLPAVGSSLRAFASKPSRPLPPPRANTVPAKPPKPPVPSPDDISKHIKAEPGASAYWEGIPQKVAESTAKARGKTTLQAALGEYGNARNPDSPINKLKGKDRVKFWENASTAFAAKSAAEGHPVEVMKRPPPNHEGPSSTIYNRIEKPILTGETGGPKVSQISHLYPTVPGRENEPHQAWPKDDLNKWLAADPKKKKAKRDPSTLLYKRRWAYPSSIVSYGV
jgi:hypothetical protein